MYFLRLNAWNDIQLEFWVETIKNNELLPGVWKGKKRQCTKDIKAVSFKIKHGRRKSEPGEHWSKLSEAITIFSYCLQKQMGEKSQVESSHLPELSRWRYWENQEKQSLGGKCTAQAKSFTERKSSRGIAQVLQQKTSQIMHEKILCRGIRVVAPW